MSYASHAANLPKGFVYLQDVDPSVIQTMKYYSADNFIGRPIKGYVAPKCILTQNTAQALAKLQVRLKSQGLGIKIYDCYRPTMAVNDFINWSRDIKDQRQKNNYYPAVDKADFFKLGYVAEKSGHSRGSTVDLTLVRFDAQHQPTELDMGTHFDFMDETSHPLNNTIHDQAKQHRMLLRTLMAEAGFIPLETEWWHFTLKNEDFPNTYFNFLVQ